MAFTGPGTVNKPQVGRASKRVEKAKVIVDAKTGNCLEIRADSGINCGNRALPPDSLQINNNEIRGDNPPCDFDINETSLQI